MIYIKENENMLEKYEVVFDKEKLQELIVRVIKNCGEVHNKKDEFELYEIPNNRYLHHNYCKDDDVRLVYYENVKSKLSNNKRTHYHDYSEYEEDLYDCEYTEYVGPYFAYFIQQIINGDVPTQEAMFNRDYSSIKHLPTVEEKIEKLNNELLKFTQESVVKRKEKLEELNRKYALLNENGTLLSNDYIKVQKTLNRLTKELSVLDKESKKRFDEINSDLSYLLSIRSLNINQQPIDSYIKELENLVEFKQIDKIDLSEIQRFNSFFDGSVPVQAKKYVLKRW